MRLHTVCAALLLLASVASPLAAQLPDSSRVRVSTRNGGEVVGTLLSMRGGSVRVRPEGRADVVMLAPDSIARLEVSDGVQRHTGRGALIGAVAGVAAGAVIGAASHHDCQSCFMDYGPGLDAAAGGILGGVVGAVVGAVVGHQSRDVWRAVPVSTSTGARVTPMIGVQRAGVVATLRF